MYADELHLLGNNINNTKKSTESLIVGGEVVGLEVNTGKSKYMLVSPESREKITT
jgi:hypothetical protein